MDNASSPVLQLDLGWLPHAWMLRESKFGLTTAHHTHHTMHINLANAERKRTMITLEEPHAD